MHSSIRIRDVPSPQNNVSLHASSLREMLQMSQRSGRGPQELTPLGLPQRMYFDVFCFLLMFPCLVLLPALFVWFRQRGSVSISVSSTSTNLR